MKVYRIFCNLPSAAIDHYEGTLGAAHKWAKTNVNKPLWADIVIEERELETDKASLIDVLNFTYRFKGTDNAKVWGLTVRGGLEDAKE